MELSSNQRGRAAKEPRWRKKGGGRRGGDRSLGREEDMQRERK